MTITETTPQIAAGVWDIDPSHSSVEFVGRHLMVTKIRGRFDDFTGTISIGEDPLDSSVEATVQVGSIDTRDEKRDEHLRSADFFDVEHYPTMELRSTGLRAGKGGAYVLTADLIVHGVTRSVDFDLEFDGTSVPPWGGPPRAGFSASATVNRKDWGLEWNVALETGGVLVSEKVTINLEVEAIKREEL